MPSREGGESKRIRLGRWWPAALLTGLGLFVAVVVVSASTATPQANEFRWKRLSAGQKFAAYPDMAVGSGGLVAAIWTEGETGSSSTTKHKGPLKLAWISDSTDGWQGPEQVEPNDVFDAALAVSGSTAHVVWIPDAETPSQVYYRACVLSSDSASCTPEQGQLVAVGGSGEASKVSRVEAAVDQSGAVHVVWVEDDQGGTPGIYYTRKPAGGGWEGKSTVGNTGGSDNDFPVIATNRVASTDYIHVAWAKRVLAPGGASSYHVAQYCRRNATGGDWDPCTTALGGGESNPARNLSITADGDGNVYAAWDILTYNDGEAKRNYALGYRHSSTNGASWWTEHTYQTGNDIGFGGVTFTSGEDTTFPPPPPEEYVQFLRPSVSLAVSDTETVPVLAWHARISTGGGEEPALAQVNAEQAYKVLWAYASESGSYDGGYIMWSEPITLSTDLCGEVDMRVDSASASLVVVGDLRDVIGEGAPTGDGHLHAVYHEETSDYWMAVYNSDERFVCFKTYMPVILKNASGGGGGEG